MTGYFIIGQVIFFPDLTTFIGRLIWANIGIFGSILFGFLGSSRRK